MDGRLTKFINLLTELKTAIFYEIKIYHANIFVISYLQKTPYLPIKKFRCFQFEWTFNICLDFIEYLQKCANTSEKYEVPRIRLQEGKY